MASHIVRTEAHITSMLALALVERAIETARTHGWQVTAAVVDIDGSLLALLRMDGVPPPITDFAVDKAYTAATMRCSTLAYSKRMGASSSLALGLGTRRRLMTWEGGLPIDWDGAVIGGIGVSGAAGDKDAFCAAQALTLVAAAAS